jgi:hypothetical protein
MELLPHNSRICKITETSQLILPVNVAGTISVMMGRSCGAFLAGPRNAPLPDVGYWDGD